MKIPMIFPSASEAFPGACGAGEGGRFSRRASVDMRLVRVYVRVQVVQAAYSAGAGATFIDQQPPLRGWFHLYPRPVQRSFKSWKICQYRIGNRNEKIGSGVERAQWKGRHRSVAGHSALARRSSRTLGPPSPPRRSIRAASPRGGAAPLELRLWVVPRGGAERSACALARSMRPAPTRSLRRPGAPAARMPPAWLGIMVAAGGPEHSSSGAQVGAGAAAAHGGKRCRGNLTDPRP